MSLKSRRCCVKSNLKAALFVLCWNLLVIVLYSWIYGSILATVTDYFLLHNNELQTLAPAFLGFLTLLYLFYPLAGCLADTRCGRYKTAIETLSSY